MRQTHFFTQDCGTLSMAGTSGTSKPYGSNNVRGGPAGGATDAALSRSRCGAFSDASKNLAMLPIRNPNCNAVVANTIAIAVADALLP